MEHRYEHILTPLRVGNTVLKDRLLGTKSASRQLQGPQRYPAEETIAYYEQCARNGAALVTVTMGAYPDKDGKISPMALCDMSDWDVLSCYQQITDRIHAYGSLACASLQEIEPHDKSICWLEDWDEIPMTGEYSRNLENKPTMSVEDLQAMVREFGREAKAFKRLGFDAVNVYMSYRGGILANSLSPVLNQRTDEYGGSFENRARLSLEVFRSIKEACGGDIVLECQVSAVEEAPGYDFEEFLRWADLAQEYVDIFQLRAWEGALNHGNGYNVQKHEPPMLQYAQAMKEHGIRSIISPVGAFQDLDDIERFLAEGKCDTVSMARAFICDPEYGKKLLEGRGEDVVPCLRCNMCHGGRCRVNPRHGLEHVMQEMFPDTAPVKRKVAVAGGGPAGMMAAITAARRGHQVDLYEKSESLGGQLGHADHMPFKWPVRDYRDWLVRQVGKEDGITVHLGTAADPALLTAGHYDAVIAACGAVGIKPASVKGAEKGILPMDALGDESLGQKIVVVGGGEIGFETGLALAAEGRSVTVLSRRRHFPCDMHTRKAVVDYMDALPSFAYKTECRTQEIGDGYVLYLDPEGQEHRIDCDDVVFAGGREGLLDEAIALAATAPISRVIGDAKKPASVAEAVYAAYTAAMSL